MKDNAARMDGICIFKRYTLDCVPLGKMAIYVDGLESDNMAWVFQKSNFLWHIW